VHGQTLATRHAHDDIKAQSKSFYTSCACRAGNVLAGRRRNAMGWIAAADTTAVANKALPLHGDVSEKWLARFIALDLPPPPRI